jgi:PAS domain S-box-containing protein
VKLRLFLLLTVALLVPCAVAAVAAALSHSLPWGLGAAVVLGIPLGLAICWKGLIEPLHTIRVVRESLSRFASQDIEIAPSAPPTKDATGLATALFESKKKLRIARSDAKQQQELLKTIIESAPMAVILYGEEGRIVFTNAAARELFFAGQSQEGQNFITLLKDAPPVFREAFLNSNDDTFTVEGTGEPETYRLSKRYFELSGQTHTLLMVQRLTREFSRQEVDVWKKVIRVMSHELNNSLAPISSLIHSARMIAKSPEQLPKLERVFDTISERSRHLQNFLEGYARFARLPKPKPVVVPWRPFLDGIKLLYPQVTIHEPPVVPGEFDPGQMEQVVINLLKNAIEAGGPPEAVSMSVSEADGGLRWTVEDRGKGLSPEVLRNALLPFYTTKPNGSGLGLTLCREIVEAHRGTLHLAQREGGGAMVTCWIPRRNAELSLTISNARLTMTRG